LIPWKDRAKLSNPLVIEAKIKDDDFVKNPSFETKLVSESGGEKQGVIIKEKVETPKPEISEDFVDQVAGKLKDLLAPKIEVKEQDEMPPEKEEGEEEEVEEYIERPKPDKEGGFGSIKGKSTSGGFGSIKGRPKVAKEEKSEVVTRAELETLLADTIQKFNLAETEKPKEKKIPTLREFRKNLTTEDIYKYMERAGTKSKQVQEIVYDQACALAESAEPIEILRQVIKVLKKKK
jgi:hypothetical protein